MKNKIYSFLMIFIIISCNLSKKENPKITEKKHKVISETNKDSVIVPRFEIQLNLSKNAEKKLKEENEKYSGTNNTTYVGKFLVTPNLSTSEVYSTDSIWFENPLKSQLIYKSEEKIQKILPIWIYGNAYHWRFG